MSYLKKCLQRLALAAIFAWMPVVALAAKVVDYTNHTIQARVGSTFDVPYNTTVEIAEGESLISQCDTIFSADESVAVVSNRMIFFAGMGHTTVTAVYEFADEAMAKDTVVWDVTVERGKSVISFIGKYETVGLADTDFSCPCFLYVRGLVKGYNGCSWTPDYLPKDWLTFSSADTTIAKVDAKTGVVTPVSVGQTDITAVWEGNDQWEGDTASYCLMVHKSQVNCYLDKGSEEIVLGESYDSPSVKLWSEGVEFIFSSSDTNVATIDSNSGVLTPVGYGSTTITMFYAGNDLYFPYVVSWTVKVTKPHIGLYFEGDYYESIGKDDELIKKAYTDLEGEFAIYYRSDDESIATVDSITGKVAPVKGGYTYIYAIFAGDDTYECDTASYMLWVEKKNVMGGFDRYGYDIYFPTVTMEAPSTHGGEGYPIVWTSSNPSVATVDSITGTVTAVGEGTSTITATCPEGNFNYQQSIHYTLYVNRCWPLTDPTGLHYMLDVGQTMQAPAVTEYEGVEIVWSSADETVATVDSETGEVTAVGAGNVVISATAQSSTFFHNQTVSYELEVIEAAPEGYAHYLFTPMGLGNGGQNITEGDYVETNLYGYIVPVATDLGWEWGVNSQTSVDPNKLSFNVNGSEVVSRETTLYTRFRLTGNLKSVRLGKTKFRFANCKYVVTVQSAKSKQTLGSYTLKGTFNRMGVEISSETGIDLMDEELLITIVPNYPALDEAICEIENGILLTFNGEFNALGESEADGLEVVDAPASNENRGIYNLCGQRVDNTQRGIVLMNGKRVMKNY